MSQRMLIVEDEEVIRKSLSLQLSKAGYEVLEAEDGQRAILHLADHAFDLIICDIVMPNKDGWQLMKETKESPKARDIPVITLTAKSEDKDMFKAYDLRATYYIPKPFTKARLLYGVEMILSMGRENKPDIDPLKQ